MGSQSQDGSPVASDIMHHHRNRRSQVFDMSPSSSDNEGEKHNALLRVQRRRQSSRRLSQIAFDGGPTFRPLDVLICEDHPVSRMVMEKLLEKLRCRTISVPNGSEAVRYSMSEIKFDVIFLEYQLPQINGADVARMIRETKNANSHTPIVAITAYLKELQAPHYFDSLIEKPISSSKLTEVLRGLCQWRPESPGHASGMPRPIPMGIRKANSRLEDSPTSGSSVFAGRLGAAMMSSREDSITSSLFGDSESVTTEELPVVSRKATNEWDEGGLNITDNNDAPEPSRKGVPHLVAQQSAPAQMEHRPRGNDKLKGKREGSEQRTVEGTESADDEDEELGGGRDRHHGRNSQQMTKAGLPSSKLGIEMMRANSHDSLTVGSESTPEAVTQVVTTPSKEMEVGILDDTVPGEVTAHTPPDPGLKIEGLTPKTDKEGTDSVDATPRPLTVVKGDGGGEDEEATPTRSIGK